MPTLFETITVAQSLAHNACIQYIRFSLYLTLSLCFTLLLLDNCCCCESQSHRSFREAFSRRENVGFLAEKINERVQVAIDALVL